MAKIKLGLLISEIAGSLQGGTFRRSNNGLILQRATRGAALSKLALNKNLASQSNLLKSWNFLTSSQKAAWEIASQKFVFNGKLRGKQYLSGRELYLKLIGNLRVVNVDSIDLGSINSLQPGYSDYTLNFDLSSGMNITFNNSDLFGFYLIQIQRLANAQIKGSSKRSKFLGFCINSVDSVIDFETAFLNRFPYATISDKFLFTVQSMNNYGFRNLKTSFIANPLNTTTVDVVNLYEADPAHIELDEYTFLTDFDIETNVLFKFAPFAARLFIGSAFRLEVFDDGGARLRVGGVFSNFILPSGLLLNQLMNFRVMRVGSLVSVFVDSVLAHTYSSSASVLVSYIGSTLDSRLDFSQASFRLGSDFYPVDEMTGATLASSGVKTATIDADNDPNLLWQTIVL